MGRIKTQLIKRLTQSLLREHVGEFAQNFDENKPLVARMLSQTASKKIRNAIAGYATRLTKEQKAKEAEAARRQEARARAQAQAETPPALGA